MKTLGERLAEERDRLGYTQEDFASKAGVSRIPYISWEKDRTSPRAAQLAALAYAGADVRYIVTGERDYAPPEPIKAEERVLLDLYRAASRDRREFILDGLRGKAGGDPPSPSPSITAIGGHAAGRDVTVTKKTKRKP